jgi:hypothetical protein
VIAPSQACVDADTLGMPATLDRFEAPPVFICGCARSGTTWALDLFGHHPDICAINESWILSQTHGVTSVLAQPSWGQGMRDLWRERMEVPLGAVQLLPYEEMVRDLRDLVAKWLARPARDEHRFLVAKEFLDVRAAAILFPEARFIHVIRDGRDVALSMRRSSETWNPTMGAGLPIELRAEGWRRQVEIIRAQREFLGERYLEIRYEDMRADVVAAMRSMFDFSQIPYEDALLERIRQETELASYGEAALKSGFRGSSRNGGWRTTFTAREWIAFDRVAGELVTELGYERGRRWLAARLLPILTAPASAT